MTPLMTPLGILLALLAAAAATTTAGKPAGMIAAATTATTIGTAYRSDWANVAAGREPPEWVDVSPGDKTYAWLYPGDWAIRRSPGEPDRYGVSPYTGSHPEPLTFRRFAGSAFGPDGTLPRRFRIDAEARSTGGASRFGGVGELSIQTLYVDPTHYLEIMQVDKEFRVWWADGAEPQKGEGWKQLGSWKRPYRIGEWMQLGAEMDLDRGVMVPVCDGRKLGEIPIPPELRGVKPRLTIRATGNGEEWRRITIEPLP